MITYLKMAWRNLWRNKRRTFITMASIIFSVFFATVMRTFQEGSYNNMIDNLVKFYSGYLQVQDSAYWGEKTLDNSIEHNPELSEKIASIEDVTLVTPRIESGALAAYKDKSKPVMVLGIYPEKEDKIIKISEKMRSGEFLNNTGEGVIIAEGLAKYMNLSLNDTIVLLSQGYHGISATGKFRVQGIFYHPNPEFNRRMIYMNIPTAQTFYGMENRYSCEIIMAKDHYNIDHIKKQIATIIPQDKKVMTWDEMSPDMLNLINGDRQGGLVMLFILYLVIGFGIFGTATMMIHERKREFAVVNSLGMKKYQINITLFFETLLLGITSALAGILISLPLISYFYKNPLPLTDDLADAMMEYGMEPYYFVSMHPSLFINQAIIIAAMCIIISFLSMFSIKRMKMIDALRG